MGYPQPTSFTATRHVCLGGALARPCTILVHWFSGTRATVSSYRMQRDSDVCESVCEAGVIVRNVWRPPLPRVSSVRVRREREYVCVCAQSSGESKGPINSLSSPPPLARTVLRRAQIPSAPKAARRRRHARALSLYASLSAYPSAHLLDLEMGASC